MKARIEALHNRINALEQLAIMAKAREHYEAADLFSDRAKQLRVELIKLLAEYKEIERQDKIVTRPLPTLYRRF